MIAMSKDVNWAEEIAKWRPELYSFARHCWRGVEVIGVAPDYWVADTKCRKEQVVVCAARIETTGEDPFFMARYLSSGNDAGAVAYGPSVGGHMEVRVADGGEVLAKFMAGEWMGDRA